MAKRILIRRDSTLNWETLNPILSNAELGIEILNDGKRKVKVGTGNSTWTNLPYLIDNPISETELNNHIDSYIVHGATSTPTENRIAMYDGNGGLKSNKLPSVDNDVVRNVDLTQEITNRENAISDLQSQVTALGSITSIRGSVDTYADLPDPTTLQINEAYIVEQDENKENKTSVYSVINDDGTNVWEFIAEFTVDLSNYYTKTESDSLSNEKIDKDFVESGTVIENIWIDEDTTDKAVIKGRFTKTDGTGYDDLSVEIPNATPTRAGIMIGTDKAKLNSIVYPSIEDSSHVIKALYTASAAGIDVNFNNPALNRLVTGRITFTSITSNKIIKLEVQSYTQNNYHGIKTLYNDTNDSFIGTWYLDSDNKLHLFINITHPASVHIFVEVEAFSKDSGDMQYYLNPIITFPADVPAPVTSWTDSITKGYFFTTTPNDWIIPSTNPAWNWDFVLGNMTYAEKSNGFVMISGSINFTPTTDMTAFSWYSIGTLTDAFRAKDTQYSLCTGTIEYAPWVFSTTPNGALLRVVGNSLSFATRDNVPMVANRDYNLRFTNYKWYNGT
jgi:hypothetical protein